MHTVSDHQLRPNMTDRKSDHWESVYNTKEPSGVSWFRPHLDISLALLVQAGLNPRSRVIDIGAGASTLVDDLLDLGVSDITALDISATSLQAAKNRLSFRADQIEWVVADVARAALPVNRYDLWHDRAALHFLTDPSDAASYVTNVTNALATGGCAVIAGFAKDGPEQCSSLPVMRREPEDIATLFGAAFTLIDSRREQHMTPWGTSQSFAYSLLRKER
jgi:SAM-dependent methyltransferase